MILWRPWGSECGNHAYHRDVPCNDSSTFEQAAAEPAGPGPDSGRVMIELTVDAVGLARSRFAVSPLHEVVATLLPWGVKPGPLTPIRGSLAPGAYCGGSGCLCYRNWLGTRQGMYPTSSARIPQGPLPRSRSSWNEFVHPARARPGRVGGLARRAAAERPRRFRNAGGCVACHGPGRWARGPAGGGRDATPLGPRVRPHPRRAQEGHLWHATSACPHTFPQVRPHWS